MMTIEEVQKLRDIALDAYTQALTLGYGPYNIEQLRKELRHWSEQLDELKKQSRDESST